MGKLNKKNIQDILALTPMQEGMLFHYLKEPDSDHYFEQLSLVITGAIDIQRFEGAWNFVIRTNEMLRTVFRWEKVENPIQIILEEHYFHPKYYDRPDVENIKVEDRKEKFDLQDVPFRVKLCKIEENKHEMIISNHHILYDGWSNGIILKEFFNAYNHLADEKKPRKPLKTKFKEFVQWIQDRDAAGQEKFWRGYLRGFESLTGLSAVKKNAPAQKKASAGTHLLRFDGTVTAKINRLVKKHRITLASFLYTAWGLLLQRYNNTGDVVFGTTVSGRTVEIKGIQDIVGIFINTVPLRIQNHPGAALKDILANVDNRLKIRREYEHTSLVDINRYHEAGSREELFDTVVILENYPLDARLMLENRELSVDSYTAAEATHYDLTVVITVFHHIDITFTYNKALFAGDTAARLGRHFECIAANIEKNPGGEVSRLDIIPAAEKKQLLEVFNDTAAQYPKHKTLHRLFLDQVERTPDSTALVGDCLWASGDNAALGRGKLAEQAGQLARLLQEKGVKPGTAAAIMVEPSLEMIIGLLGILGAGGAYLPIDPEFPAERITFMLEDSCAHILLTQNHLAKKFASANLRQVVIDVPGERLSPGQTHRGEIANHPHSLAYVTYTSGSTGRPKGVMIENRSFVNFARGIASIIHMREDDNLLSLTTISFDIFGLETFLPLTLGTKVVIGGRGPRMEPGKALELIERENITIFQLTPSRLKLFLPREEGRGFPGSLRYLLVGGEEFPGTLLQAVRKLTKARIYNLYGPTETTIWSTVKEVTGEKAAPDIGGPICNTLVYILNSAGTVQPLGVPGELYIGGDGTARGYLNRPELTAEKFISRKKIQADTKKSRHLILYRTGDLARWKPGGNIEFLSRLDFQVKIRGFRIELGEIEARLLTHKKIKQALVTVRKEEDSGDCLTAYIVSRGEIDTTGLRKYLSGVLPGYMVPAHFVPLEQIPLTANGKVDRKALPPPGGGRPKLGVSYISPRGHIEKVIEDTWKKLLKLDRVGIDDNFFDLGGNSFSIIRLSSRLKEAFNREIPIAVLFNYPTIRSLAEYFKQDQAAGQEIAAGIRQEKMGEIAVIGMAGCFPGAANIKEFWENLKNGVDCICFFSDEELKEAGIDEKLLEKPNYIKAKGVLAGIEYFDASFFDFTGAEAFMMDPQVRLFHELSWASLEDAGYVPGEYNGLIGVYAGMSGNFPWLAGKFAPGLSSSERFELMNLNSEYFSTLVSYKLNLKGPSISVHTACSTSLTAVVMACQALADGHCHMALAGGIGITYPPKSGYLYQEGMIFSSDGHCRTFDSVATGTVGGNGAGVVVLKPLEAAAADGDHIYALIKGAALNNDGKRKVGYTAPSVVGQVEAITCARQRAGIAPETIGYIETHGTGTSLGDPVEIEGLKQAFMKADLEKGSIPIGSVKSNIGHLDVAAGVAGFIKTVLALIHRQIPPSLHYQAPNPQIDFELTPFYVNGRLREWENKGHPLRAGVSSFGIGGTNAHVILEEAPGSGPRTTEHRQKEERAQLIVLSARTPAALERMTENLADHFRENPGTHLADTAYTLAVGRKRFDCKRTAVCRGAAEGIELLSAPASAKVSTFVSNEDDKPVIFMFPGQGAQYKNMGLELLRAQPIFREEMERCFEILTPLMGYDIKEILYPGERKANKRHAPCTVRRAIDQTEVAQPVLFVFEYALARLLMHWGIKPDGMIGHSIGEYTAACLAGVFSLEDALSLVALRGKLMQGMPPGAMLSVPLPGDQLEPLLNVDELSLAAVNSPSRSVVSGSHEHIDALAAQLGEKGCKSTRLHTSHAFHSKMMGPIVGEFEKNVKRFKLNTPHIPFISNITGKWVTGEETADPGYWAAHLRKTVRFTDGVDRLLKEEQAIFVEMGPGNVLSTFVKQHTDSEGNPGAMVINLAKHPGEKGSAHDYLLNKIGQLWLYGKRIDWVKFYGEEKVHRLPLPTYPFERGRYWSEGERFDGFAGTSGENLQPAGRLDINEWFYIPSWKRSRLPAANLTMDRAESCWLVFSEGNPLDARLVERLKQLNQHVVLVKKGNHFKKVGDDIYHINHHEGDHYDTLLDELHALGRAPDKVLHLWNVTGTDNREPAGAVLDGALDQGFYSLLHLARAIGKQDFKEKPPVKIAVLANHMQEVTGEETLCPVKATLLGPCKVIPQEYPNIKCRCIDIVIPEPGSRQEETLIQRLVLEFSGEFSYEAAAYRGSHRWRQIFEPISLDKPPRSKSLLKEKGVYLITGGLGGIGLVLSEHLAKSVNAGLILTARSQFPARDEWGQWLAGHGDDHHVSRKIRKIRELEKLGADVLVVSADVSDRQQMEKAAALGRERFGRIDGVIHAAGVAGGGVIQQRTRDITEKVMSAKVTGTLILDDIFKDTPLDFFILCSSISSLLGAVGQVGYCAANAFLDAFAHHKNSNGGTTTTVAINWDAWKESGMAVEAVKKLSGLPQINGAPSMLDDAISAAEGVEVFDRVLAGALPQVVVSTQNFTRRLEESNTGKGALFQGLSAGSPVHGPAHSRPALTTPYISPGNKTEEVLAHIWKELLGFERVGICDNFYELGGDSLKAITAATRIREELQREVSLTDFFTNPTIEMLAGFIDGGLGVPGPGDRTAAQGARYPAVTADKQNIHKPFPLTNIQTAYMMGRSDHFGMGKVSTHFYLEFDTQLDVQRLNKSLNKVIARHPMMRAVVTGAGEQQIPEEIPVYVIQVEDLTHLGPDRQDQRILQKRERMSHHIFDLDRWPLFEIKGLQLSEDTLYLIVGFDLIIADASSMEIIAGEIMEFYRDDAFELPPLEFSFRDYVLALREFRDSEIYETDKKYWLNQLDTFPLAPHLPLACNPSEVKKPYFKRNMKIFPASDWSKLCGIAKKHNITPSILLCTAYAEVLAYWSSQREFAINLTIFNRYPFHKDVAKIVGDFTSLVLVGLNLKPGWTFWDIAREIHNVLLEGLEHRHYDGVEFIRDLSRYHNLRNQSVMPVVFTSNLFETNENNFVFWDELGDIKMGISQTSQVFLDNQVRLQEEKLVIVWDYVEELFEVDIMGAMFEQYITIITAVIEGRGDYWLKPPARDRQLWEIYNETSEDIPAGLLHHMFQEQARRTPGNIALEYGEYLLTYRQLDKKSNQVAHYLKEQGVARGRLAAVITDRSIEAIVNVMGVLKAGGAYVPIDPDYPEERRNYIFASSNCRLMLRPGLYEEANLSRYPGDEPAAGGGPDDLAYVIYTSGSTGKPKGVMITHREAVNTIVDINRKFNVGEEDRVMGISSMCFDLSVYDVFGTLSTGARLVLIPTQKDIDILAGTLTAKQITIWNSVPAILDMVVKSLEEGYVNTHLSRALLSGDWIPLTLPGETGKYFPHCEVISLGGATEGSVWSIYYPIGQVEKGWNSIPYGRPLANQTFYVLNYRRQLCPVGVPGELYIGGAGVAEGYLNDQERTREAFIRHPGRGYIYRTGDYGVFHRRGYIEFLGRKDQQVKIRGYRVELGEIEACLLDHRQVRSAVVMDRAAGSGARYLSAYILVETAAETTLSAADLKIFLAQKLPDYMVPAFFVILGAFPLTQNGKIDKAALNRLEVEGSTAGEYEAPVTDIEKTLVRTWSGILDIKPEAIGAGADFFELGGHSLKAIMLISKIRKEFKIEIPLEKIFEKPVLREMAASIGKAGKINFIDIEKVEERHFYGLSFNQERLWFVQQVAAGSSAYNMGYSTLLRHKVEVKNLERVIYKLAQRHEGFRTAFKTVKGKPVQFVLKKVKIPIETIDLSHLPKSQKEENRNQVSVEVHSRPFDLNRVPLCRVILVKLAETLYEIFLTMHHIIGDAWSIELIREEFHILYQGERNGTTIQFPPVEFRYKDFAAWHNREIKNPLLRERAHDFWKEKLIGGIPQLELSAGADRGAGSSQVSCYRYILEESVKNRLNQLARDTNTSLFIVMYSLFNILLSNISGNKDIPCGFAVAGRGHPSLYRIMGFFVNALILLNTIDYEMNFSDFLAKVKADMLEALKHQDYPLELVCEDLKIRYPRSKVFFNMHNLENGTEKIALTSLDPLHFEIGQDAKFDIELYIAEYKNGIMINWHYRRTLFTPPTIVTVMEKYKKLIDFFTAYPEKSIDDYRRSRKKRRLKR